MERLFLILAGINGFLAVALGAFGAHGLRSSLASAADGTRRLEVWELAAHYQLAHAVALGLVAYLCTRSPGAVASAAGYLFVAGIVLFSGSLYALAFTGVKVLGAITPIGGLCFLAGWVAVIWAATKL
ncbi:MAG TPA: DUF423 domain-containing protein [Polyangiales bacterium]|nr:DUF423 domain-containing protein [Polyangiales bacterium]